MNAIDGDRSVFHDVGGTGGRCSETSKEASPWWMADLMRPTAVNAVRMTTRTCCGNFLLNNRHRMEELLPSRSQLISHPHLHTCRLQIARPGDQSGKQHGRSA